MEINELWFQLEIYDEEAILKAISAYKSIADITLTKNQNYCVCCFTNWKADLQKVKCEFANYVLAIMVK